MGISTATETRNKGRGPIAARARIPEYVHSSRLWHWAQRVIRSSSASWPEAVKLLVMDFQVRRSTRLTSPAVTMQHLLT